ncbi:uncharacterized protein [Periplaneta americana]|uniref:uncharacterized protein isoform X4 n=1 Tax=Periplaneta americana TaxID=6978 RepID=UPI0037E853FE
MDMIKEEPEVDPLATQSSDNTDTDEKKPLSEEGNLLDLHVTGIKTECVDNSYDFTSETKFEETAVPTDFVYIKCKAEDGIKTECKDHSCGLNLEMALDETLVPIDFPVVKSEVEEGKVLDLHVTEIKTEYMDHSYDVKSEMTFEESSAPVDFPIMKSKAEEEQGDLDTVNEDPQVEVAAEDNEVFTESYQ